MLKGKRTRKVIALTLLITLIVNTFAPTAAYALTSGPTSPEATSFEPVDTSDMVNLTTGDFTYNVPLLEVPGPEGGYPLSLSYHAGIQPNEDASWVGLGWTLNPGAINRNVNGYPDDWYSTAGGTHMYWEGGTSKSYNLGVTVGITNYAGATFGLSFSQDTYKGFGVGMSLDLEFGSNKSPFYASVGIGVSPYGDAYGRGGVGLKAGDFIKESAGVGFETNFKSVEVGTSATIAAGASSLSIDGKGKTSWDVLGYSHSVSGTTEGSIQTKSQDYSLRIPAPWGSINVGYKKVRYWIDDNSTTTLHGGLYSSGWGEDPSNMNVYDNVAYDSYSLLEDPSVKNMIDNPDPQKVQGGAFPDFDIYSVNAQGLGGSMRPYLFQGEVLGQNKKDNQGTSLVTYYSPGVTNSTPQFRFIGDFSNSFRQNDVDYTNPNLNLRIVAPPFDGGYVYGNNDGNYGFTGGNGLAGSRFVSVGASVLPSNALGYTKTDRYQTNMIEGFSITNENGVTYHYGLPAYSWDEENYQEKIDRSGGLYGNRGKKPTPYAYVWYLTTITGPDFVDRDNDSKAGPNDWGYYVNFEYGKWSNNYVWRNPSEGFNRDEDNQFQNCAMGRKEVYYLNAIKTRSHTAIFQKEIRNDGWGASPEVYNKNINVINGTSVEQDYTNAGLFNTNGSQSLRLSKIYLFDNSYSIDPNAIAASGNLTYVPYSRSQYCADCEKAGNVIDQSDVTSGWEANALRVIDFNYDYSLCKGVSNNLNSAVGSNGKLTLKSIRFRGKGGASLLPPMLFDYDLSGTDVKSQTNVTLSPSNFSTTNGTFEVGDMIKNSAGIYCGVITAISLSGSTYTYTLANGKYTGATVLDNVSTTKNPDYNKDAYDIWGMYKSDVNSSQIVRNENLGRMTSVCSSKSADAWSLRTITTALGGKIKIRYESNDYQPPVLNDRNFLTAQSVQRPSGFPNQLKITFDDLAGVNLTDHFVVNGTATFLALLQSIDPQSAIDQGASGCSWYSPTRWQNEVYDTKTSTSTTVVKEIGSNYIVVENPDFAGFYQSPITTYNSSGQLVTNTCDQNRKPVSCNVAINNVLQVFKGGGIRVKQILSDNSDKQLTTSYNYYKPNTSISSGVVSYEPWIFELINFFAISGNNNPDGKKLYQKAVYNNSSNLLSMSREILPPGVMYEYVSVTNEVKNTDEEGTRQISGKTQYQFEVFRDNMIGRVDIGVRADNTNAWGHVTTHNLALKKFEGSIGTLKRIVQYDKDGHKLTETINHYLHDGLENLSFTDFMDQYKIRLAQYLYQGFLQERYSEVKVINDQGWTPNSQIMATLSAREEYPCIPTGQTVTNYVNGTQTTSETLGFDFYSGAPVKTVETDGYGNRFMTEVIPAYRKYSAMGLKLTNGNNKNMLTQKTATYSYKVDANNAKLGLVHAQVQTWSNSFSVFDKDGISYVQNSPSTGFVWREEFSYGWLPNSKTSDGMTAIADFPSSVDFNWTTPTSSDARWKKTAQVTRYDVYSKALEAKDVNSNAATTRMNYNSKKVELTASPANFYEAAYSGAEDLNINQTNDIFVKIADGVLTSGAATAHTGLYSLKLGVSGKTGFVYTVNTTNLVSGRNYKASVWVKPTSGSTSDVKLFYDINGTVKDVSQSSGTSTVTANGWSQINLTIKGSDITPGTTLHVGCRNDHGTVESFVDDFRFQPLSASATAFVYDAQSGELTFVLDNSNLFTKFEYDGAGRLVRTSREKNSLGLLKLAEYDYNMGACLYHNNVYTQVFTKNDCTSGYTGSMVAFTVPVNRYCSSLSQIDADAQAQNDANANGQRFANSNGVCLSGGGIIRVNATLPGSSPTTVVLYEVATGRFRGVTNCFNGTTYINIEPGNYSIQISQPDNVSRTVSLTGYTTQTGSNVTFGSVSIGTNQLILTVQ